MTTEEAFWDKLDASLTEIALQEAQHPQDIKHAFEKLDAEAGKEYLLSRQKATAQRLADVKTATEKLRAYLDGQRG